MKKTSLFGIAAVALFTSVSAYSAPAAIQNNAMIQVPDCPLLAEDVRIPLSNSVIAARNCVGGPANSIRMAACHTAGREGSRTIEVPCTNDTVANPGVPQCADPAVATNRVTNTGAAIMLGTTTGGQVGPTALDGSACNAGTVAGRIPD
ncbi:hypothetical protein NUV66_04650 [Pseudomonas sp. 32.2.56]|uniref:hypothetical protein n=1 Tax=Pseudomonas TaxID=286 RepID=UPI001F257860|nr:MULTISPECIES: hypothetical protein [Pseudomonas]MCE5362246.1 hypothetical protein [Pseudomonas anguilliseptica]MCR4508584.1 hypothetical protein [Pseudomonas sp. 32.2.56]